MEYDDFGFEQEPWSDDKAAPPHEAPAEPHVPMRTQFPPAGSNYVGGTSDGWEYRTAFVGARLAYAYEMLRAFLVEEGYGDVPLPETMDDLRLFRKPRGGQLQLFGERGYAHNPIKILFPSDPKQRNTLILCIFNEKEPKHLLRFHGLTAEA